MAAKSVGDDLNKLLALLQKPKKQEKPKPEEKPEEEKPPEEEKHKSKEEKPQDYKNPSEDQNNSETNDILRNAKREDPKDEPISTDDYKYPDEEYIPWGDDGYADLPSKGMGPIKSEETGIT